MGARLWRWRLGFRCRRGGWIYATQERVGRTIGTRRVRWLLSGGQGLGGAASRRTWKTGKEWLAEES